MPNRRENSRHAADGDGRESVDAAIPRWYWLAYLTGGFGLALNAMMNFLLPLRATDLGISIGVIGLLLGIKGATEALASVPIGGLIDRMGPRRAFIIGTAASTVLIVLYAIATSVWAFLFLQIAVGTFRPMAWVGAQSYVSGLREGAAKATDTGRLSFVATGAQIIAPLLVGFGAQAFGTGPAFFVFAGYCAIYVLVGLALPKGSDSGSSGASKRRGLTEGFKLLAIPGIRTVMYLSAARLWINGAWVAFFPLLLVTSGVSEGSASTVVSSMAVVGTILSPSSGRLAKRFRVEYLTAFSLICGAAGLALAPAVASIPAAYGSAFLLGIGHGISLPMLLVLVSKAVPADQRGLALGLRSSVNQAAAAAAPPLVAAVIGASTASVGFPLAAAVGLGLVMSSVGTHRRNPP
ncbi:MAG: MFS transporter [Acidimicrobiia bacterium]|nr:MFS transporter [Acidimicrobiia bacterium]